MTYYVGFWKRMFQNSSNFLTIHIKYQNNMYSFNHIFQEIANVYSGLQEEKNQILISIVIDCKFREAPTTATRQSVYNAHIQLKLNGMTYKNVNIKLSLCVHDCRRRCLEFNTDSLRSVMARYETCQPMRSDRQISLVMFS